MTLASWQSMGQVRSPYEPASQNPLRTMGKTWDVIPGTEDEFGYSEIIRYRGKNLDDSRFVRNADLDGRRLLIRIFKHV